VKKKVLGTDLQQATLDLSKIRAASFIAQTLIEPTTNRCIIETSGSGHALVIDGITTCAR
jgi:hypothetical protein